MANNNQSVVPHEYYDLPSEQAVIASLLAADESNIFIEVGKVAEILLPDDFYGEANKIIYTEIIRRFESGQSISPMSVLETIRASGDMNKIGGVEYIKSILEPSNLYYYHDDVSVYANIVLDESKRRKLWRVALDIQAASHPDSGLAIGESITIAESTIRKIADDTIKTDAVKVRDVTDAILEQITLRKDIPVGATIGIPSGFIDLDRKTSGWKPGQFIIVAARPAMGKALALDTKIPTPEGWKTMGDIQTGDMVYSPNGYPIQVTHVTEVMEGRECFRLAFSDGTVMVADGEHEWGIGGGDLVEISNTNDLYLSLQSDPRIKLDLPPHMSTIADMEALVPDQPLIVEVDIYTSISCGDVPNIENPWILPLGLRNSMRKSAKDALRVYENSSDFNPTESMKIEHWIKNLETSMGMHTKRHIISVEKIDSVPVKCIQVDSEDHFYLAGNFIPTHNSTIALDFARAASMLAHKTVVLFSLEMSKEEILEKILSAESRVAADDIKTGNLMPDQWRAIQEAKEKLDKSNLIIDDSANSVTLSHIRTVLQRQRSSPEGLDMAIIDYIQLMSGATSRQGENRQQEVSELSRGIKLLAKELQIPIFGLAQLNRGPAQRTDKRPMVSDLRESGSLEQDADMVLLIHRPEVYDPNDSVGIALLDVAKHRNGSTGVIQLNSLLHISKFSNATGSIEQRNFVEEKEKTAQNTDETSGSEPINNDDIPPKYTAPPESGGNAW